MRLDYRSPASSGLVSERQRLDVAACCQVGMMSQSNLLRFLNLNDSKIVNRDLDRAKPYALERLNDLRDHLLR